MAVDTTVCLTVPVYMTKDDHGIRIEGRALSVTRLTNSLMPECLPRTDQRSLKVVHIPFRFAPDPVGGTEIYVETLAWVEKLRGSNCSLWSKKVGPSLYDNQNFIQSKS